MAYIISGRDIDLSRGCCSCPFTHGKFHPEGGNFCGRLDYDDDVTEHIKKYTRPDHCPFKHLDISDDKVYVMGRPKKRLIQEWHSAVQRPGKPKYVIDVDDIEIIDME